MTTAEANRLLEVKMQGNPEVYFAAPLFSEAEKKFNEGVVNRLAR